MQAATHLDGLTSPSKRSRSTGGESPIVDDSRSDRRRAGGALGFYGLSWSGGSGRPRGPRPRWSASSA